MALGSDDDTLRIDFVDDSINPLIRLAYPFDPDRITIPELVRREQDICIVRDGPAELNQSKSVYFLPDSRFAPEPNANAGNAQAEQC
jgi:hypothetical protein